MMRIGFLPSDFNPMILMLAEAEDIRALGGVLRRFAREGRDLAFRDLGFCRTAGIDLLLTGSAGSAGVQRRDKSAFVWRVPADLAAGFADRLDDLAEPGRIAGSEALDCGTVDGITVKVSRGEYTDDFLGVDFTAVTV
ncbi:hypothetical protein [Rhodopila sp.]|uniref:hypothetical protein n=1 Tax=Rhodopila sp. TaxID=2480087 RepID=UPI003D0CD82C